MRTAPILIAVLLLVPVAVAQDQSRDLVFLRNELSSITDSLEAAYLQKGYFSPNIENSIVSIRETLNLSSALIDQGLYEDARSLLVQTTSSVSLLKEDIDGLDVYEISLNDMILVVLIIALIVIISSLYVILIRMRKNPYK
jgi:hypothetical protein